MSARFRLLPTVLLVSGLYVAPVAAQNQGAGPPPGGQRGPGGPGRQMMDPTLIDGPLMPEEFGALASLDATQESRYATLYQNLMTSTRTERDELKAAREKRRQAMSGGTVDRQALRAELEKLQPAYQRVRQQQETFESALKEFLSKDQLKKYSDWKDQKREEMRAQFGGGNRRP